MSIREYIVDEDLSGEYTDEDLYSYIAYEDKDGNITFVYCHQIGSIDNAKNILPTVYKTPDDLQSIMNLGDIYQIEKDPAKLRKFSKPNNKKKMIHGINSMIDKLNESICMYLFILRKNGVWYAIRRHVSYEKNNDTKLRKLSSLKSDDYMRESLNNSLIEKYLK